MQLQGIGKRMYELNPSSETSFLHGEPGMGVVFYSSAIPSPLSKDKHETKKFNLLLIQSCLSCIATNPIIRFHNLQADILPMESLIISLCFTNTLHLSMLFNEHYLYPRLPLSPWLVVRLNKQASESQQGYIVLGFK